MHSLVDELLSLSQQLTCQDSNSGGSISDFLILSFRDFDKNFSSRVVDMHRPENSSAVIGDADILVSRAGWYGDEDLVHASWAEGCFD